MPPRDGPLNLQVLEQLLEGLSLTDGELSRVGLGRQAPTMAVARRQMATATPVFAASLLLDARQVRPSSVRLGWNISPKLGLIFPHYTYDLNLSLGPTRLNKPTCADLDSTLCRH